MAGRLTFGERSVAQFYERAGEVKRWTRRGWRSGRAGRLRYKVKVVQYEERHSLGCASRTCCYLPAVLTGKEPDLLDDLAESSKEHHQSRIRSLLRTPVSFHLTPLCSLLTSHASPTRFRESPLLFKMRTAWGI